MTSSIGRIRPKADLIFGDSGTRKTSNIGLVAMYVLQKYGKRTRLLTLDGGGFDVLLPLVDEGIIVPWVPLARPKFTISTIDLAMQGYWPVNPDDPESPLAAPTAETFKQFGFLGIEGLTSMGDAFIRQLKRDKAHLSQDPSYVYSEQAVPLEGGKSQVVSYSGGNMSYFGAVQDQLYDFVQKSHLLAYEKIVWTALEGRGEDTDKSPKYGPSIVGRKSTGKATQWFGNSVHIEQLVESEVDSNKQLAIKDRPVMYTSTHADPMTKVPFPCKTRAPYMLGNKVPKTIDPPDMAALYRILDELNEEARKLISIPAVKPAAPAPVSASVASSQPASAAPEKPGMVENEPHAPSPVTIASPATTVAPEPPASVATPATSAAPVSTVKMPASYTFKPPTIKTRSSS